MATKTDTLTIRISPEMKAELEKAAAKEERSVSWLALKLITAGLKSKGHLKR
jgi:predicted transcriptional regulator